MTETVQLALIALGGSALGGIPGAFVAWQAYRQSIINGIKAQVTDQKVDATVVKTDTLIATTDKHGELLRILTEANRRRGLETSRTILVIDDDPLSLKLAATALGTAGYTVRQAVSAEAALEDLTTMGIPDLIVCDVRLPDMGGFELARQLRLSGCHMPILAHSAHAPDAADTESSLRHALSAGCNDFVPKAAGTEPLLRSVARWLAIADSLETRALV